MSQKVIGLYTGAAREFYGNMMIPVSLSLSDRLMLVSKYRDNADWIELKVPAASVKLAKRGNCACVLMKESVYLKALESAGYAKKGLTPISVFEPDPALVAKYFLEA